MQAAFTLCTRVFTAQCRLDAAAVSVLRFSTRMCCCSPNHITKQFSTSPTTVYGPGYARFWSEILNVIVTVPVMWSDKINLSMSTTSDFKVQIESPDDWPKWKWQILMILRVHCLEGITDGSRKCPVLPADAQPQQKKELTEWWQVDTKAASITACTVSNSVAELVLTCTSATDIWDKLKLRRSLHVKVTRRSRILWKWIPVNPWKGEMTAQNRHFLATIANNLVTGLRSVL